MTILLLLCLILDFAHPWAPGVFFFEGDRLFVESVVTLGKVSPPRPTPAHEPHAPPLLDPKPEMRDMQTARNEGSGRLVTRTTWRPPSRSSGRSSPPPASPDAH